MTEINPILNSWSSFTPYTQYLLFSPYTPYYCLCSLLKLHNSLQSAPRILLAHYYIITVFLVLQYTF